MGSGLALWPFSSGFALLTWNAQTSVDVDPVGGNAVGPIGSILSDLLMQSVGLAAVLAVLPLMFFAVELFQKERIALLSARLVFWFASVLLIASGFAAIQPVESWPLQHGFGGLAGDFVYGAVRGLLDTIEPSLGGLIAAALLGGSGVTLLFRALNIAPKDLYAAMDFGQLTKRRVPDQAAREPLKTSRFKIGNLFRWSRQRKEKPYPYGELRPAEPAPLPMPMAAAHVASETIYPAAGQQPPFQSNSYPPVDPVVHPAMPRPQDAQLSASHAHGAPQKAGARTVAPAAHPISAFPGEDHDSRAMAERFAPSARAHFLPNAAEQYTVASGAPRAQPPSTDTGFCLPGTKLLAKPKTKRAAAELSQSVLRGNAGLLEDVLSDFGVKGEIVAGASRTGCDAL